MAASKKLIIATGNQGKLKEFKDLLDNLNIKIYSLKDFPQIKEIEETGSTFKENALIKARKTTELTGITSLADDSGLEVDWLNGQPGVNSARFAGEPKNDQKNNLKLLRQLAGVPLEKRTARFKCVIAIVEPNGNEYTVEGSCEGLILDSPRGTAGFGYDPLFYIPSLGKSFAELDKDLKNKISHRGKAVEKALNILRNIYSKGD